MTVVLDCLPTCEVHVMPRVRQKWQRRRPKLHQSRSSPDGNLSHFTPYSLAMHTATGEPHKLLYIQHTRNYNRENEVDKNNNGEKKAQAASEIATVHIISIRLTIYKCQGLANHSIHLLLEIQRAGKTTWVSGVLRICYDFAAHISNHDTLREVVFWWFKSCLLSSRKGD